MSSHHPVRVAALRSTWLSTGVFLASLASAAGCAPSASTVPLGLGPLARAEQDAQAQADADQRRRAPKKRAARAVAEAPAPAEAVAKVEPSSRDSDAEDDSKAGASSSSAPVAFEGLFAGDDTAVYRLTGIPEREEHDDKAKIRVEKAASGNVTITLINSTDGSDLCALVARVEGNAALIESAQPCFGDGSEGSIEAELTSGRAVLRGLAENGRRGYPVAIAAGSRARGGAQLHVHGQAAMSPAAAASTRAA